MPQKVELQPIPGPKSDSAAVEDLNFPTRLSPARGVMNGSMPTGTLEV